MEINVSLILKVQILNVFTMCWYLDVTEKYVNS